MCTGCCATTAGCSRTEAGVIRDDIERLGKKDALVAISLAPYTRATIELAARASQRGAAVLAVTDSAVSPVAQVASNVLLCGAGGRRSSTR